MSFQTNQLIKNHKICNLRTHADQTQGSADQLVVNLQEEISTTGNYERSTDMLLIIEVTDINSTGTLVVVGKDAVPGPGSYDADFVTLATITATGIYYAVVQGIRGVFKLYTTVANATVAWGAKGVTFDAQKRPVVQADATAKVVTYGTGR
jgi:hypothetical protein